MVLHNGDLSKGGELTDDRGLRIVWTDDVGIAGAVSSSRYLPLGS